MCVRERQKEKDTHYMDAVYACVFMDDCACVVVGVSDTDTVSDFIETPTSSSVYKQSVRSTQYCTLCASEQHPPSTLKRAHDSLTD